MVQDRTHLKVVSKRDTTKLTNESKNLVDMLQSISETKQDLYEMLESVELLEEEIKQALYAEQGTRKK